MCVLMVCFNVLELLLDETAMPRGMEVRIYSETTCEDAWCATLSHLCTLMVVYLSVF